VLPFTVRWVVLFVYPACRLYTGVATLLTVAAAVPSVVLVLAYICYSYRPSFVTAVVCPALHCGWYAICRVQSDYLCSFCGFGSSCLAERWIIAFSLFIAGWDGWTGPAGVARAGFPRIYLANNILTVVFRPELALAPCSSVTGRLCRFMPSPPAAGLPCGIGVYLMFRVARAETVNEQPWLLLRMGVDGDASSCVYWAPSGAFLRRIYAAHYLPLFTFYSILTT